MNTETPIPTIPLSNLIKGVTISAGIPNGGKLASDTTQVWDFAKDGRQNEFNINLTVNPAELLWSAGAWNEKEGAEGRRELQILKSAIFQIADSDDGVHMKRDILELPSRRIGDTESYTVRVPVQGGKTLFTKSQENYIMFACVAGDGIVHVFEVVLIIQNNKVHLIAQNIRSHVPFLNDTGTAVYADCTRAKRTLWPQLSAWAAEALSPEAIASLSPISEWKEKQVEIPAGLPPNTTVVAWASARRQQAGLVLVHPTNREDGGGKKTLIQAGKDVTLSFHQINDDPGGFNFVSEGDVLKFEKLVPPRGGSFPAEALGITHL